MVNGTMSHTPLLEEIIGALLIDKSHSLAVAESCTGGLISARITGVAGSSRYFKGGVVAYSNEVKSERLSVSPATLDRYGAVSAETAVEMVRGVREFVDARVGLSVTGIAGPTGGSAEKPVGTVFIAAGDGSRQVNRELHLAGTRQAVREESAEKALTLLRDFLRGESG